MLSRSIFRTTNHHPDGWVYSEHAVYSGVLVIGTGSIDDYGEVLCASLASTLWAVLGFYESGPCTSPNTARCFFHPRSRRRQGHANDTLQGLLQSH